MTEKSDSYGMAMIESTTNVVVRWMSPDENIMENGRIEFVKGQDEVLLSFKLSQAEQLIESLNLVTRNARANPGGSWPVAGTDSPFESGHAHSGDTEKKLKEQEICSLCKEYFLTPIYLHHSQVDCIIKSVLGDGD